MGYVQALEALKQGKRVTRADWNGSGMWLTYVAEWTPDKLYPYETLSFIAIKTVDDKLVPWFASQKDMWAEDWEIVE